MATVLVHLRPGIGPVGVWAVTDEQLRTFYPDQHAELHQRARAAIEARSRFMPVEAWFEQLTDRVPYFDDYALIDVADPTDLHRVYRDAVTAWSPPRR